MSDQTMTELEAMTRLHALATRFTRTGQLACLLAEAVDAATVISGAQSEKLRIEGCPPVSHGTTATAGIRIDTELRNHAGQVVGLLSTSLLAGIRTRSMTWMTPFSASTSAWITVASLTVTPPLTAIASTPPSTVFCSLSCVIWADVIRPGDDVIGQHPDERGRVGEETLHRLLRQRRERVVGRREDRER